MTNGSETPDQAATRRRWISLAEVVAVAGVVIAGLSLYLSWADRRDQRKEQTVATRQQSRAASVVTLRATRTKEGQRVELADAAHPVDAVDIAFPTALGITPQLGLVTPVIEAKWLEKPVLDLNKQDHAGGRVPVLITSTFWEGVDKRTDRAIYDLAWKADGGLFGRSLKLEGAVLRERGGNQARLDAIWKQLPPKPKPE